MGKQLSILPSLPAYCSRSVLGLGERSLPSSGHGIPWGPDAKWVCVFLFSLLSHIEPLHSDFLVVSRVFWAFSDSPSWLSFLQKRCPGPGLAPGLDFTRGMVKNVPPAFSVAVGEDAACVQLNVP